MFNKLRLKVGDYILRRSVSRHVPEIVTLSRAKKIAILFDAKNLSVIKDVKVLLKYFLKLNIDVEIMGFVNSKKKENGYISTLHINYFDLNDVSFFGIPKTSKINLFLKKRYDMLINLSLDNSFSTKYLAFMSNAKFRIGVCSGNDKLSYDLMLKLKIKSIDYLIEHTIHYLELINKNNEK